MIKSLQSPSMVLTLCIAISAFFFTSCGGGEVVRSAAPGTKIIVLNPYNADLAGAIQDYAAPLQLKVVEDGDYREPGFLGKVDWDTRKDRVFGRPYRYRSQEDDRPRDNSWKLSNLWGSLTGSFREGDAGDNEVFEISSDITFSDYRTYDLPTILTYDDQETAETFCRMIAQSAQWIDEGERRAIAELNSAKRIRALQDLRDRISFIVGGN